jgi:hypothetical protein
MTRRLAIPAALVLTTAFVRAAVNADWDGPGLALAVAAAATLAAVAARHRDELLAWFRDPRGVFAVTTGVTVALFAAALVMLNIVVWYNPWSVDLTASGRNQVSGDTRTILERLETPVTLSQFGRVADSRVEQMLRGFERATPRVGVEFVDVERERARAARYGVIKLGTVVVSAGEKFRKIEDPNEQALVTAILQATSDDHRVVCFVTGHGERGLADEGPGGLGRLQATLQASNYGTERITLLDAEVPLSCSALVVAGPRQPYSSLELDRLTAYVRRGGRVALLVEPDPLPSFEEWLVPLGIAPLPGAIVDVGGAGRTVGGGPRTPLAVAYGAHEITRGFEIATMFDGARPLRALERPAWGGRPVALSHSSARSFSTIAEDGEGEPAYDGARGDVQGPLTLAAATAIGPSGRPEAQARVVVFGDADLVSNGYLGRQGNRDFFLRALAWLLGEQEATVVAIDDRENRRLELTEQTRAWMYLINLGLIPLIPLAAGIVMFVRSRR